MMDFSHINVAKTYEVFQDEEFFYLAARLSFPQEGEGVGSEEFLKRLCARPGFWRSCL